MQMHATSLQKLGRDDDYIRIITRILSEICSVWKKNEPFRRREAPLPINARDLADEYFAEVVSHGKSSPQTLPLSQYFGDLRVDKQIVHYDDRDGFQLRFSIHNLLQQTLEFDKATLVLVEQEGASEILLASQQGISLSPGATTITLNSSVSVLPRPVSY